jgi:predicted dehydrogenase
MSKKINIAIIGTGSMGRTHSYSAINIPFFYENLPFKPILHTICSRDSQKGEKLKEEWGFLYAENDINKILTNPEIDVIDICTPNIFHFETILNALEHKKNIYCEKPLVISNEEAVQVLKKSENHKDLTCAVVFHNRFYPAVLRAKQLIEENRLGKIMSFRCAYLHNSNIDVNKNAGWKQDSNIGGGGVLFDLGSHAIDLMRFLCGGFRAVSGTSQIFFPVRKGMDGKEWQTNADEAFYITAQLTSGAIGTIEASKLATGTNSELKFEIYGEKGALRYNLMQPNYLEFYDIEDTDGDYGGERGFKIIEAVQRYPNPGGLFPSAKAPIGWLRAHMHSYYLYLDSVYNNKLNNLLPAFSDGAAVQKIMEKAYLSDKNKCWESMD